MCQKQINTLTQLGVSVELANNKTMLICSKQGLTVEYSTTKDYWFVRDGDGRKMFGFEEMLKRFKQLEEKPKANPTINGQGLTVRDYFATHAMEGMVTDVVVDAQKVARMAYELADAMMKERGVCRG